MIALTQQAYVLAAGREAGVTTVAELVAKAKRGTLTFGSTGIGTGTHVGVETFNQAAGIEAVHMPPEPGDFNADTVAKAAAGRFTYCLLPISLVLPHIREGTLVALGVSTARRSSLLAIVPAIADAGIAGFDFPIWYGLWVAAATPAGLVDQLEHDVGRALDQPDMRAWIAQHGGERMRLTRAQFTAFVARECEATARLMSVLRSSRSDG